MRIVRLHRHRFRETRWRDGDFAVLVQQPVRCWARAEADGEFAAVLQAGLRA